MLKDLKFTKYYIYNYIYNYILFNIKSSFNIYVRNSLKLLIIITNISNDEK